MYGSITPCRLLFVEDDPVDQLAFKNYIKKEDLPFEYVVASTVDKGRMELEKEQFDVVITDFKLSDGNAFELLEYAEHVPIIFLTGAGDEEVAVTALKNGAFDYVVKDLERNYLKILAMTVTKAVRQRDYLKSLQRDEERLRIFTTSMPAAVAMLDQELNYVLHSRAWADAFNLDTNLKGSNLFDGLAAQKGIWDAGIDRCLNGQKQEEAGTVIGAKGQTQAWRIHPWRNGNGAVAGVFISLS